MSLTDYVVTPKSIQNVIISILKKRYYLEILLKVNVVHDLDRESCELSVMLISIQYIGDPMLKKDIILIFKKKSNHAFYISSKLFLDPSNYLGHIQIIFT
jgi:hypothetical protein